MIRSQYWNCIWKYYEYKVDFTRKVLFFRLKCIHVCISLLIRILLMKFESSSRNWTELCSQMRTSIPVCIFKLIQLMNKAKIYLKTANKKTNRRLDCVITYNWSLWRKQRETRSAATDNCINNKMFHFSYAKNGIRATFLQEELV